MPRKPKAADDTFTTVSGKTMTRKQLQNLVSKANYKVEHADHLTVKEQKELKKRHSAQSKALGLTEGKLSIKGITDKRKLRAIEAAARHTLASTYVQKKKYKKYEERRYKAFEKAGFVTSQEEYEVLKDIFHSDAWAELTDIASPYQLLQSLQDMIFAEGKKTDPMAASLSAILQGFARLSRGEDIREKNIKSGTWEDIEQDGYQAKSGTWYTDDEHNDYFVPNISAADWEEADAEERAQIIIEALAEILR